MDPVTALATASSAFAVIKKGISVGRDIESMIGDVSRWMGALSDLDQAEKEAKNPPIFKKLVASKTVEQEAMEIFAAKRKAQQQREELRTFIQYTMGQQAWDDLIKTEARVRKERQETIYRQRERRQKFLEICAIILLGILTIGIFIWFIWLMKQKGRI